MATFKDMLKYLRSREGLSQSSLAEKLGISKSTISMYEVGRREPDFETLEAIADLFNVDMNFLLGKFESENQTFLTKRDSKDEVYKKIFSKNLNYYMKLNEKTQTDLVNNLGLNKSAVSTWCNGTRLPRMDKVDMLAKYFGINRSDLIEEKDETHLTRKDERDIEKILDQTRQQLLSQEGLMFDGDPASPEAIDSILDAMQIGMEMAKKKNKEKYTPKKYRKD